MITIQIMCSYLGGQRKENHFSICLNKNCLLTFHCLASSKSKLKILRKFIIDFFLLTELLIHRKGFAFIQFQNRADAVAAIIGESGTYLEGNKISKISNLGSVCTRDNIKSGCEFRDITSKPGRSSLDAGATCSHSQDI